MDQLHWTEVNGITTIWTEAPEPLRAGLMFRTGRADETYSATISLSMACCRGLSCSTGPIFPRLRH